MEMSVLWVSIISSFLCVALLFKSPKFMYYFGLAVLYVQSGLILFKYQEIHNVLLDFSVPKYTILFQLSSGLILAELFAIIPFFIPLLFAYFTSVFLSNTGMGIVSFFFFSIIQVVIVGRFTGGDKSMKGILKIIVDVIPILSFFITLFNVFPSNESATATFSNVAILSTFCCCLTLIYAGFLFGLYLYYNKSKRRR